MEFKGVYGCSTIWGGGPLHVSHDHKIITTLLSHLNGCRTPVHYVYKAQKRACHVAMAKSHITIATNKALEMYAT